MNKEEVKDKSATKELNYKVIEHKEAMIYILFLKSMHTNEVHIMGISFEAKKLQDWHDSLLLKKPITNPKVEGQKFYFKDSPLKYYYPIPIENVEGQGIIQGATKIETLNSVVNSPHFVA